MADIPDILAAGATKIVGSDSSGTEQTPVQSTGGGGLHVNLRDNTGTEILVSTAANQATLNTRVGDVTETAPASDTASSGLNGRLQRIAQRLTSLIALIPSSVGIAWFSRISDGTNTAAVKAASTAAVASDPSLIVGFSPNSQLPAGTALIGSVGARNQDGAGTAITSASNGLAGNQLLHTQTPDTTTAATSLNALNATVQVAMAGLPGCGFQLAVGTLIGTLVPESSLDGGTTWQTSAFLDSSTNNVTNSIVFTIANTLKIVSLIPINGASHVRVRVSAYTSGSASALLRASMSRGATQSISTEQVVSSLPAATVKASSFINAGVTAYTSYTATQTLAFKQFYAGGTGIGKQVLYRYSPANTSFVNAGDFETPADIGTTWLWASSGGTGSIASSTSQFFTGARAVQLTFSNSSGGNAQGVKQTFSSPVSYSGWRYISTQFYNTLSAGGAYTRTISIILTDVATNTRKYDVSGLSTASPFNASGWIKITGEIENPTSTTGTGFDITQISSIELRMADTANKSGVVYWDTVQFEAQLTALFPIFHAANDSFNANFDPVAILAVGEQLLMGQTNNDATRKEFFALAGGVAL